MFWDSGNDACEICQCSSMIKKGCQVSENCCSAFHHDSCSEKENSQQNFCNSPLKNESDLSLYSSSSPSDRTNCGRYALDPCDHQRFPLKEHDQNSQDSGYEASCTSDESKFYEFARSLGVTPRQCSPMKPCSLSFGSMDSMDDEFLELVDLEKPMDENAQLPTDFNTLINGPFPTESNSRENSPDLNVAHRAQLRRSISYDNSGRTPNSSRVRSCLFKKDDVDFRSFKRPEPPIVFKSPIQNKRPKVDDTCSVPEMETSAIRPQRPVFGRSMSATEESIKCALQRSSTEPDLIGDFSTVFCLPLTAGRHQDLKSITPQTLAALIRGEYRGIVNSFKVIDCRYPYEFNGGHIERATNLFTKEQVVSHLLDTPVSPSRKSSRNILVFHCEFSSERGPNLYRFLRKCDRLRNTDAYPALHYPEIYLLEGGYKGFFEQYSELCAPKAYLPMLDSNHSDDLRHFRAKSKTWNADKFRSNKEFNFKRLGFP